MSTADGSVVGTTKIVDHGPSSERWDLVLMGDGYQSGQLRQFATDTQSFVDKLFATAPFDSAAVAAAINVHRVDVTSTDSGADDPTACVGGTGATARTYFDASFCHDGVQRLLEVDEKTARSVADAQVPNWNMVMVIVNSTIYSGSGGSVATFSLGRDANGIGADETGLHEMGHTAFGLADEYESFRGCDSKEMDRNRHSRDEPAEQNVTIDPQSAKKWGDLIEGRRCPSSRASATTLSRAGGASSATRASWPTPPVTAAPTSSVSAAQASWSRAPSRTAASPMNRSRW